MCLACEEMDLYFAYLEQREAAKRAAAAPTDNGVEASESSLRIVPAGLPEVPPDDKDAAAA
jgi:hypothetical protein